MSDCCHTTSCEGNTPPKKARCPANGKEYSSVSTVTIKHHIKQPWNWQTKAQGYYFCDDPDCEVVYFGEDLSVIDQSRLRTEVGIKTTAPDRTICYCFGVSMDQAIASNNIKSFIMQETRKHECACETRNPSGKCCLNDFPKN